MSKPTLVVLCGLPASGKSTLARELAGPMRAVILSNDRIRTAGADPADTMRWLHGEVARLLVEGTNVITDTCALRPFERSALRDIGRRLGARCELVFVNTPWRVCAERNALREHPAHIRWLRGARTLHDAFEDTQTQHRLWDDVRVVVGAP